MFPRFFTEASAVVTNTLFPLTCVGCGLPDVTLCAECFDKIIPIQKQACIHCSRSSLNGKTCTACRKYTAVSHLLAATHYQDGPLKEALHTFKYDSRTDIAVSLEPLLLEHPLITTLQNLIGQEQALVVPVPLHRRRLWQRGFNQSEKLALGLAKVLHLALTPHVLKRKYATSTQVKLKRLSRAENVANAFEVPRPETIKSKTVVVLDDIVTTGATLSACASALQESGAKRVIAVALARD